MCMKECTFLPLVSSTRAFLGNDARGLTVGWYDLCHLRKELIYSVSPQVLWMDWDHAVSLGTTGRNWTVQMRLLALALTETGLMAPTGKIEKWPNMWRKKGSQEGRKLGRMPANLYLSFEDRYLFLEEWKLAKEPLNNWMELCTLLHFP